MAVWLPSCTRTSAQWFPGTVTAVSVAARCGSSSSPSSGRRYHILFDDGDEADDLAEAHVMSVADFGVGGSSQQPVGASGSLEGGGDAGSSEAVESPGAPAVLRNGP